MVNRMLVASGTHGVVRILVGGYLLLQVPSRFDPCPLRHIEGYLSRWPSFLLKKHLVLGITVLFFLTIGLCVNTLMQYSPQWQSTWCSRTVSS